MKKKKKKKKKKADVCHKFGLLNSTTQKIWKNRTKIIIAFEQNRLKIMWFQNPEWS
jgi:hypothetical protein